MTNTIGLDVHFGDGLCDDPECCPQQAPEEVYVNWQAFVSYLIDKHETETIYEESMLRWLSDFVQSGYNVKYEEK